MIPFLVVPVINRFDLLERMLASIDEPVARGLVVDNARSGYRLPEGLAPNFTVFAPPYESLGYTGSINFAIGQTSELPWWLWASNDEVFGAGDLSTINHHMEQADGPRIVTENYAWGALNRAVVDAVGLFDEWSFWPIYYDDQDYAHRCQLAGVEWIRYTGSVTHGADGFETSLAIHSDPKLAAANARSWALNKAAYVAKWGGVPPDPQPFETPWNAGLPLWATRPDLAGRAKRRW